MIELILFGFFGGLVLTTFGVLAIIVIIDMDNEKKNKDKK